MVLRSREIRVTCGVCVFERGVQCVRDVEITSVRRHIGAVLGLVSHWIQLQMAKQQEVKGGGDCCVCFVCAGENRVL